MRALLLAFLILTAPVANAACRHALVLALDVSGSVSNTEYRMQVNGLADALASDEIKQLFLNGMPPIHVAVFEWSSQNHQGLIQPWTAITDAAALDALVARIRAHQKQRQGLKTAIGRALEFSRALLADKGACWQQTIDISGDGRNNIGPVPRDITAFSAFDRVTVNALIVTDDSTVTRGLNAYYTAEVIHGPSAFVMEADGYRDYTRAMQAKLARELRVPIFGHLSP